MHWPRRSDAGPASEGSGGGRPPDDRAVRRNPRRQPAHRPPTVRRSRGGPPAHRPPDDTDRGAVTIEAAIAIGTLVLVVAAALGAVATVLASVRCLDAARELVRAAARGDTDGGRAVAARIAPSGSRMDLTTDGDTVVAVVAAAPVGLLPFDVTGTASGTLEPGVTRSATPPIPVSPPGPDTAPDEPSTPDEPVGTTANPNARDGPADEAPP